MINYQRYMGNYRVLSSKDTEIILQVAEGQETGRMPRKQKISFETEVGQFKEGKEKHLCRYKDKWVGRAQSTFSHLCGACELSSPGHRAILLVSEMWG